MQEVTMAEKGKCTNCCLSMIGEMLTDDKSCPFYPDPDKGCPEVNKKPRDPIEDRACMLFTVIDDVFD